jgi:hypothetical protein
MIINTVNTKLEQLTNGYFKIGSGTEKIFVMGSCRAVPYLNYLHDWNEANGNRFTICFIDPFNWCFDLQDNRTDFEAVITSLEKDERILHLLKTTDIFLHEYYNNFGMFNCKKQDEKNVYKFGMAPKIDVCICNFNDLFILFGDIVTFDAAMRKNAISDYNVIGRLSEQTKNEISKLSQSNIEKFYHVCRSSDVPEMADYFANNFTIQRLFWSYNHVSKYFTLAVFKLINDKFLRLDLSNGFNEDHVDMFANNYTKLTEYDVEMYGFNWGEEIIPLKDKLF